MFATGANAQSYVPDVTSYELTIEPDIKKGTVTGSVVIKFQVDKAADSVVFNSGNLQVDKVSGNFLAGYKSRGNTLIVRLMKKRKRDLELTVGYHGKPASGVVFDAEHNQVYTVFSTGQWMVCNDAPSDKAMLFLNVITENDRDCVGSGVSVGKEPKNNKTVFSFIQRYETPAYTYGFSIGKFREAGYMGGSSSKVKLKFYGQRYSPDDLRHIFRETSTIMSFFEKKSGVFYTQHTYTQVLIGDHYQEMSGFSVLKESYGRMVLLDSTEINLISHELAHQWWGNRITCKTWGHFWLNEGMATFMSAAFNPPADGIALDGLERAWLHIERATKDGSDREARLNLMSASMQGAMAFQKGLGCVHSLSHSLGGIDPRLHHGTLNALFLPAVIHFNAGAESVRKDRRLQRMAQAMHLDSAGDLGDAIRDMSARLGLPTGLAEVGVTPALFEKVIDGAMADHCHKTNPRLATRDDYRRMLEASM